MTLRRLIKQMVKLAGLLITLVVALLIVAITYAVWHHKARPEEAQYVQEPEEDNGE